MQEKLAQVDEVREDVILQEVNIVLLREKRGKNRTEVQHERRKYTENCS